MQKRYRQLVTEHLHAAESLTAGIRPLPSAASSFASVQAAWRFFANPRTTLPVLLEPAIQAARTAMTACPGAPFPVLHDWSDLAFATHARKSDRLPSSKGKPHGYELATALIVHGRSGAPIAPVELRLRTAQAVFSSRQPAPAATASRLDELLPTMQAVAALHLPGQLVHVIDREADSVRHLRQWHQAGHSFLVRSDNLRRVRWKGVSVLLDQVVRQLERRGGFRPAGMVCYHGQQAERWLAETTVVLDRPARGQRGPKRQRRRAVVPGEPLRLRLVVSQVLDEQGRVLAEWRLFSNVFGVIADWLADWYYWRWQIESYFKLLKSAGHQLEAWQQETGAAVAKRLAVASMACVLVWNLARDPSPEARTVRRLLVRLSGHQMKRGTEFTEPALLAGVWVMLGSVTLMEKYTANDLRTFLQLLLPKRQDTG